MSLRSLRFLNLLLVMADFGLMFAHVLEIPGKLRLSGATWLTVQHNIYVGFGTVGAAIEVLAILTTWAVFYLVRERKPAARLTLLAAILVSVAFIAWLAFIDPINGVIADSTADTLPADWTSLRFRWDMWHSIRAAMYLTALGALIWAILAETPRERGMV